MTTCREPETTVLGVLAGEGRWSALYSSIGDTFLSQRGSLSGQPFQHENAGAVTRAEMCGCRSGPCQDDLARLLIETDYIGATR